MRNVRRPRVARLPVGVTGAAARCTPSGRSRRCSSEGCHLEVVFSDYGRRLLADELGPDAKVDRLAEILVERYGEAAGRGSFRIFSNRDLGAPLASGSTACEGMVVVPCSMKTLAGVAHGLSRSLIERAADVMLKERRRLVLVPRETPMSLPELRNMVLCCEAGATVLPAMPAFYQMPKTLDDLADFMAGKILGALGLDHDLYPPWTGQ